MTISLITLASQAEAMAFHANAAKILAPFAPDASAQHLKNARTFHDAIAATLGEAHKQAMASKEEVA